MRPELIQAIEQVGREKGIDRSVLIEAVGAAILSASRKTLGPSLDLKIRFDDQSGRFRLFSVKRVVESPVNPKAEVSLPEALKIDPEVAVGGQVEIRWSRKDSGGSRPRRRNR
ncbi:MAG: NusA N-terminal domain-containing protein [candidate division NC10 bacterium]|nr:NusA N-terminal domain-containing protein [candidate division NC10 bacterium]